MPNSMTTTDHAPVYVCQPWCTAHVDGTPLNRNPDPADQLCTHTVYGDAFGEFLLTHSHDDGLTLHLHNTKFEQTDRDALEFITAVTAAIAQARTAATR